MDDKEKKEGSEIDIEKAEDYTPDFYEVVTADGKRYLSYPCFKCNKNHLIRTTSKEISKIRASFRIVQKHNDDQLILHCGKGKIPEFDGDGIQIALTPKTTIPKPERDKLRKKLIRMVEKVPHVLLSDHEIASTRTILEQRIDTLSNMEIKLKVAKKDMEEDLKLIKKG